jgi:hypothetical protein
MRDDLALTSKRWAEMTGATCIDVPAVGLDDRGLGIDSRSVCLDERGFGIDKQAVG